MENYIVICNNKEETNQVMKSTETYKNLNDDYWNHWNYVCLKNDLDIPGIHNKLETAKSLFKDAPYKTLTFKHWKEMKTDEFILPEFWYVMPETEENLVTVKDYFKNNSFDNYTIIYKDNCYTSDGTYHTHEGHVPKSYKQISFYDFKKYVVKLDVVIKNWVLKVTEESLPFINIVRHNQKDFREGIILENIYDVNYYNSVSLNGLYVTGTMFKDEIRDGKIEIDLKTFKKIYMKELGLVDVETKEQTLSRKQLLKLREQFDCPTWKDKIANILTDNLYKEDNFTIPTSSIQLLIKDGTDAQKEAVKELGIIFPKSQQELYLENHNTSGFKIGDVVKITRTAEYEENGWQSSWVDTMNNYVGQTLTITRDCGTSGFRCENEANNDDFDYPYFVLEKVVQEYIPFDFSDAKFLIGKIVEAKSRDSIIVISTITKNYVNSKNYVSLFNNYLFLDGSICGKLKQ